MYMYESVHCSYNQWDIFPLEFYVGILRESS
jgi:hypothetical protein